MAVITEESTEPMQRVPFGLRERQRARREESILEAAFALIVEKGYEAMTMEDLAERVGISKPTLYNHFPSKEAIAVRALVTLNDNVVTAIQSIDPGLPAVDRLEQVVRWLVRNRFSPTSTAFLRAKSALTPAKSHPDYLRAAGRRSAAVEELIAAAQEAGDIDASVRPGLLAPLMFSVVWTPEYDKLASEGDATAIDIEESIVTMIFRGIRRTRESKAR